VKGALARLGDCFGWSVALSGDGAVLAGGAPLEDSGAVGIGGSLTSSSKTESGAVHVYRRTSTTWAHEAYVKASNTDASDNFGWSVALSIDGVVLAVGAFHEDSATTMPGSNAASNAGAAYVFRRNSGVWAQEAYVKALNAEADDQFGSWVGLSSDGATLAVGAWGESSSSRGIGGMGSDNDFMFAGGAYVFRRTTGVWAQQSYIKASNPGPGDRFGQAAALSADGSTFAVAAHLEDSNATGVGGDPSNNTAVDSGAVYVY
jgi:hypothetical protein